MFGKLHFMEIYKPCHNPLLVQRTLQIIKEVLINVNDFEVYRVTKKILRENVVQAGGG